jgi:glycosyltransferase involved in cell wall biosynthesis
LAHAALRAQERASIALAAAVLTVNEALAERLVELGVPATKVVLIRNSPALARFDPEAYPARPFRADGRLRLVYAGAFSPVYELDVAVEALGRLTTTRPDLDPTLELYGRDFGEVDLDGQARELGLSDRVTLHGRIPIDAVPAALASADVGLGPTKRTSFTDFSLSTKLFEYAAMGKPVVASRLPMVERTFPDGTVTMYEPGDAADLAAAVAHLADEPADRTARVERTAAIVRELAWEHEARRYVGLVERLAVDGLSSAGAGRSVDPGALEEGS